MVRVSRMVTWSNYQLNLQLDAFPKHRSVLLSGMTESLVKLNSPSKVDQLANPIFSYNSSVDLINKLVKPAANLPKQENYYNW